MPILRNGDRPLVGGAISLFRGGTAMTRRSIAVVVATVATFALAACSEPSTAPQRTQLAPSSASAKDTFDPTLCRGGTVSTEGRCL